MRPLAFSRRAIGGAALAALCLASGASSALAASTLTQKPGAAGCIAEYAALGCSAGKALGGVGAVATSPDGRNAYAASGFTYSVAVFDRAGDGTLTQKAGTAGCVAAPDAGFGLPPGTCATATGLKGADTIAISPDGRNVYVGSYLDDAVAVFDRAADGTLTQKLGLAACISETGAGPCADGTGLAYIAALTVSSDGRSVYTAAGNSHAIAVFDRAAAGTLTQKAGVAGCVSETGAGPCAAARGLSDLTGIATSADGRSVYATSGGGGSVAVFDRAADGTLAQHAGTAGCASETTTGGACAFAKALSYPTSVTVSPDGASVYVTASRSAGVAVFDRAAGGALTQKAGSAGCVSSAESGGACTAGRELTGAASATVSPDGASLYVPAIRLELAGGIIEQLTGGMAILDRAPDGTLSQPAGMAGCVTETGGSCTDGTAVDGAASVAFSADGRNAYVAAQASNAVAVFDRRSGLPPPPPPGPAVDVTRPLLRGLSLSPARFRALARGPAVVTRGGSRIAYGLSEPARVRFTIQLVVAGRRAGGRCVPVRRSNRSARRCDRYRTLGGSFTHTGATGRNALRFSGRLRNRKLAAERYRLRAVASDATGNRSGAKVARFAIRR